MKTTAIYTLIAVAFALNLTTANASNNEMTNKMEVTFPASLNIIKERTLEISDWMLKVDAFESNTETIEIENWMLDVEAFAKPIIKTDNNQQSSAMFEYQENIIELEPWMLDETGFISNTETFEEGFIEIEEWMISTASI